MFDPNERDHAQAYRQNLMRQASQNQLKRIAQEATEDTKPSMKRTPLRFYQLLLLSFGYWLIRSGYRITKRYKVAANR